MTNANVHELFRPLLNAISQPAAATLTERRALELMYDGPIPPSALGDLRAQSAATEYAPHLSDDEILQVQIDRAKNNVRVFENWLGNARNAFRREAAKLRGKPRDQRRIRLSSEWYDYTRWHAQLAHEQSVLIDLLREQSRRTSANIQHAAE